MKELIERKGCFLIGILIIVLSNFLPFLAFAQDEAPLFPYDTVQVDGEEKEKNTLVLERKKGTPTAHIISLKGNRDGKLSIAKTSEFLIEPLTAETNITTRQEDGKEVVEIPLSQGKVTSFKLTLTGEGTAQALNATFAPFEKETRSQGPAEPQLALAPFVFQLAEIKTLTETSVVTSSSSTTRTTERRNEKGAAPEIAAPEAAAPEIPTIQRAPVGATITQTGLIGTCKYEVKIEVGNWKSLTIYPGEMDPAVKPGGSLDIKTFGKNYGSEIEKIYFISDSSGGKTIAPSDCSDLFQGTNFLKLRIINFNGNFDTSNVVNMSSMFNNQSLSSIQGISAFNTAKVTDMSSMFSYSLLGAMENLSSWDTSQVVDMSNMFKSMSSLESLNGIGGWNTSKVTNMAGQFANLNSLTKIDPFDHWDVSNVENMDYMFSSLGSVESLGDLSGWNTAKVTSMVNMFYGNRYLRKIGKISNWNTSKVTNMYNMFREARAITTEEIGDLGTWEVANVKDFGYQFADTDSLSTLNFKNWSLPAHQGIGTMNMLENSGITKIIFGKGFQTGVKLPDHKLGRESANTDDWKNWCGIGTTYGGSETPLDPEGKILLVPWYNESESVRDPADTYIITKPKGKTISANVRDAWDHSIGIGGVNLLLENAREPRSTTQSKDVFNNDVGFTTDSEGNCAVKNMPGTNFYIYYFHQNIDRAAPLYQKYWPLSDIPDVRYPEAKKIDLINSGTDAIAPAGPLYMVPRVSVRINATDDKGKPVAGVKLALHDKNGKVVTKLGSKNFVQPVTGKDGTATIKDYYIENAEDYSLQLEKSLPTGFDPANGEIFTADTTTPSKTLVHFGGAYNIDVKLKQAEVVLPMTGSDDLGDWGTVLFGAGDLALAGLIFKTIKRKYGLG